MSAPSLPKIEVPDAGAALDALVGKTFSADDLAKALNLISIHFDTDSGAPADGRRRLFRSMSASLRALARAGW